MTPPPGYMVAPPRYHQPVASVQPAHRQVPRQAPRQAPYPAPRPPQAQPQTAWNPAPPAPRTKVRAQSDDEPAPRALAMVRMPSPEELGLGKSRTAVATKLDWMEVRSRLRQLGVVSFQLERLGEGGYRFLCSMPSVGGMELPPIEARGATEEEAIRQALERADQWRQQSATARGNAVP